jgi:hypothetical protein
MLLSMETDVVSQSAANAAADCGELGLPAASTRLQRVVAKCLALPGPYSCSWSAGNMQAL